MSTFWLNPAWTQSRQVQPEKNLGGDSRELRQTLGSGKLEEMFRRGAYRAPICPACGIEVAPGERGQRVIIGETPFERILICGGKQHVLIYHEACEVPERTTLLARILLTQ